MKARFERGVQQTEQLIKGHWNHKEISNRSRLIKARNFLTATTIEVGEEENFSAAHRVPFAEHFALLLVDVTFYLVN
jgi:hypothetical protein